MSSLFNDLKNRTGDSADWLSDILSDEVCMRDALIHFWLKLLVSKYPKILALDSLVLTAYRGFKEARGITKQKKLESLTKMLKQYRSRQWKEDLLIPWNKNNDHWVLIHISLRKLDTITFLDSLRSKSKREYDRIKCDVADILQRIDESLSPKDSFTCEFADVPQQTDNRSCGVCLMVNAEYLARLKAVDFNFTDHIHGFRIQIFLQILYNSKQDLELWNESKEDFIKARPILLALLSEGTNQPTMAEVWSQLRPSGSQTKTIRDVEGGSVQAKTVTALTQERTSSYERAQHGGIDRDTRRQSFRNLAEFEKTSKIYANSVLSVNPVTNGKLIGANIEHPFDRYGDEYKMMLKQQCTGEKPQHWWENCPAPDGPKEANEVASICAHYFDKVSKLLYFLAQFYSTLLTPDTTIKQQLPLPSYKIPDKQLTEKIKVHVGIEATPPYLVRKQSKFVDLNEPKGQYRTLDSVLESDDRNQSFTINTKEVPGENIKVEFFQIFKLHNSKPVLRQYFDENSEQKRKFEKRLPKFMEFLYSEQEVPAGFLLKKKPRTQSAISSAREQPSPAYQIPGILNKMKQCTGIEEQPLYQVRTKSGMTDLCKTGKKYCTLLRVIESKCAKNGCHFTVTTVENQAKQLKVEFFQVLKLRNAKTILHEYFQNPNNSKAKEECDKFLPAFMKFLYSDSEVPESFIVHDNPESDSDSEDSSSSPVQTRLQICSELEGIETSGKQPYPIRPNMDDVTRLNFRGRTVREVVSHKLTRHGFHFKIKTEEEHDKVRCVEFFQIFKLHNAKNKLRDYFDSPGHGYDVMPKLEKKMPAFCKFLYSNRDVPKEFMLVRSDPKKQITVRDS